jgi:hypothetical protein
VALPTQAEDEKCEGFALSGRCSTPTITGGHPEPTSHGCRRPGLVWGCWDKVVGDEL